MEYLKLLGFFCGATHLERLITVQCEIISSDVIRKFTKEFNQRKNNFLETDGGYSEVM